VLLVCALSFGLVLLPDAALAWGPISHLAHGSEVLKSLTILGAPLQHLLSCYPMEYLYGCVGADITLAKKYTRAMQAHCHSWQVGWQVLAAAESDAERAFAYGYLSHLAADVFSHNHFVPTQLIVSFRARTLRHVYWEARFDSMQDASLRGIVHDLRRQRFPECDRLVRRVVARTLFSFDTNKRIFDSVLAFHDWDNWHRMMKSVAARSRYLLPGEVLPLYNGACLTNIVDLLRRQRRAECQAADPTGLEALTRAKRVRRALKSLARQGALTPAIEAELAELNRRGDLSEAPLAGAGGERARAHG
jgi:hypothetical protein